jgi:hypothetical protein
MSDLSMIDPEKHSLMVLTRLASRSPDQTAWLERALSFGRWDEALAPLQESAERVTNRQPPRP